MLHLISFFLFFLFPKINKLKQQIIWHNRFLTTAKHNDENAPDFKSQVCCIQNYFQKNCLGAHHTYRRVHTDSRQQQALRAEPCYLVTSHEAQVAEGLAALSDLRGSLVCDVLTPSGIHGLYGAAVLAYGYQSCGHRRKTEKERQGGREGRREKKKRC